MRTTVLRGTAARLCALSLGLMVLGGQVGCGETPQTIGGNRADQSPHTGTVVKSHMAPGWAAGDRKAWEAQLKTRAQAQNEYARTQ